MKILAPKQKGRDGLPTAAWLQARCGRITASRIADVMNFLKPTKAEIESGVRREGADRRNYRFELVAERLTCQPAQHFVTPYMERGSSEEDDARRAYEMRMEVMVDQTGFVQHPLFDFAGSSPDGLVSDDGGVELKNPKTETHVEYIFADVVPIEYQAQMYFNMDCCERKWWDFQSRDSRMPTEAREFIKRLAWDQERIEEIRRHVVAFDAEVNATIQRLREICGDFTVPAQMIPKADPDAHLGELSKEDFEWAAKNL